jgi:hypothetical protein
VLFWLADLKFTENNYWLEKRTPVENAPHHIADTFPGLAAFNRLDPGNRMNLREKQVSIISCR